MPPDTTLATRQGQFAVLRDPGRVWRIGYRPDPWTWTPWQYAHGGRFNGRWDDPDGRYRTLYAGQSLLGCLLEVLAGFRSDPLLAADLNQIDEDPTDAVTYPTQPAGQLPRSWLEPRVASSATLTGTYCSVTTTDTLAVLRPVFISRALRYGLPDLDAAALRLAEPRALTQAVSAWLYEQHAGSRPAFDGVHFHSRHGDDQHLIAIFERGTDQRTSPHLADHIEEQLNPDHAELRRAMTIHRLQWADSSC